MFYSHESTPSAIHYQSNTYQADVSATTVLTSRKYGVATVWWVSVFCIFRDINLITPRRLVATLGAKSNLKKVNRKAILDVDIPKACETILAPEAPMALRLQSNLL